MNFNWKDNFNTKNYYKKFQEIKDDNPDEAKELIEAFNNVLKGKSSIELAKIFIYFPKDINIDKKILDYIYNWAFNTLHMNTKLSLKCINKMIKIGMKIDFYDDNNNIIDFLIDIIIQNKKNKSCAFKIIINGYLKGLINDELRILNNIIPYLSEETDMIKVYYIFFERGLINENIIQKVLNLLKSNNFKNKLYSLIIIKKYSNYFIDFIDNNINDLLITYISNEKEIISILSISLLIKFDIYSESILELIMNSMKKNENYFLWGSFYLQKFIDKCIDFIDKSFWEKMMNIISYLPYKYASKSIILFQKVILYEHKKYFWLFE